MVDKKAPLLKGRATIECHLYYRNNSSPFYGYLLNDDEEMKIGILFPDTGQCAVMSINSILKGSKRLDHEEYDLDEHKATFEHILRQIQSNS